MALPAFIPDALLGVQPQHGRDVREISFDIPGEAGCFLRATSEVQFASLCAQELAQGTHVEKMFQVCTVYRNEPREFRIPVLRAVELDPFVESMTFTCDADSELQRESALYRELFKVLALSVVEHRRPLWDTFPEAVETVAFDVALPWGHHTFTQVASVHNFRSTFAREFGLRCPVTGQWLQQTSTGISGRAILAVFAVHFTGEELFLPASLAPALIEAPKSVRAEVEELLRGAGLSHLRVVQEGSTSARVLRPPLRLGVSAGALEVRPALGGCHIMDAKEFAVELPEFLFEHDQKLLEAATRSAARSYSGTEALCCDRLECLLGLARGNPDRKLLGFDVSSERTRPCPRCGGRPGYVTRFGAAV